MRPDALPSFVRELNSPAGRDRHGVLFVEGVRFVHRAADVGIDHLIRSKALLRSPAGQRLARHLRRDGVPTLDVPPECFRRVSTALHASGLAALVRTPWRELDQLGSGPVLVFRRLRSNGNLGTLIRSAEALGAGGIVCLGRGVDPWSPDVIRASMGGVFGVPIVRCSATELRAWAAANGVSILAAEAEGACALGLEPLPSRVAFLLGDERKGIAPEDRRHCDGSVRIPMVGAADSMNVAQAGTVLLYEAVRAGTG